MKETRGYAIKHIIDSTRYSMDDHKIPFQEAFKMWCGHVKAYHYSELSEADIKEIHDMMWKVERGEVKP